jgi:integrase
VKRANGFGTVETIGTRHYARVSRPDGSRPRIFIAEGVSRDHAEEKWAALVERGTATGTFEAMVERLLEVQRRQRGKPLTVVDAQRTTPTTTVKDLVKSWTSGDLYKEHGAINGLTPDLASDGINAWCLAKHTYKVKTRGENAPDFGDLAAADVTTKDITKVMAVQKGASGSRTHTYNRLKRLFDLAEVPSELRPEGSNPVRPYHRPAPDPDRLYNYLWPSEVFALLACKPIPLPRRISYMLGAYFGWRKATLYAFRWRGADWGHNTVFVLWQKGRARVDGTDHENDVQGTPIYFPVEPAWPLVVLRAYYDFLGSPSKTERVIGDTGVRKKHDEATVLRDDLRLAGVKREILFVDAPNVEAIRFHDLRATFFTWACRAGRSIEWIAERTGHRPTTRMADRYKRQAVQFGDLAYEPFPDCTRAIPELIEYLPKDAPTVDAPRSAP